MMSKILPGAIFKTICMGSFTHTKLFQETKLLRCLNICRTHSVAGLAITCMDITSPFNFNKPLPSCFKNAALNLTLLLVINNFPNQRVRLIKIRLQILILIGMKCCNIMHKALVKWQFT